MEKNSSNKILPTEFLDLSNMFLSISQILHSSRCTSRLNAFMHYYIDVYVCNKPPVVAQISISRAQYENDEALFNIATLSLGICSIANELRAWKWNFSTKLIKSCTVIDEEWRDCELKLTH